VRKSDLIKLIDEFRRLSGEEPPVIVGSQALHAVVEVLPEVARKSIECDFLLSSDNFYKRAEIDEKLGVFSEFQVETGFYADALGLATVVLPDGWKERLKPLFGTDGTLLALCLDPYDLAASKLIAGREKDFLFLSSLMASEVLDVDEFLKRVLSVQSKIENDVLKNRLEKLKQSLESQHNYKDEVEKLRTALRLL
jgi:hypothetical protein